MQNPPSSQPTTGFVIFVAAVAALAGLLFGYDTGVISGAILFLRKDFSLQPETEGFVVSAVLFGATFSSLVSGRITDWIGRRAVVLITAVIFVVGSLVGAFAPSIEVLVFSRFCLGLAIGVASFTAPLYISEIAPPHLRGRLVSLNQLAITMGILLSYGVDYTFSHGGEWEWMIGLGAVPAMLLGVGMLFLPESPRWLLAKGRGDKARSVLTNIRGGGDISGEWAEIEQTLKQEEASWRELLQPWLRPMLIVGMGLAFFQQVTGINTVIYYAPTIFQMAGFESDSGAIMATAGVGAVNVAMTVVAIVLIDRLGRRPLLLWGMAGMAVSLGILTMGFAGILPPELLKWIGVVSLMLYVASFAVSIGPIFWLMIAEIYPLRLRGLTMSLATAVCWVCNLVVSFTFLLLIKYLGAAGTFALFGVMTLLAIVFSYYLVPETKDRSLEEIERGVRLSQAVA